MIGWIILIALVLIILFLIGMYNSLVRLKVTTDNAWADIDVQLKRRYDLIPNLVETVKGYAGHERATLEAVVSARGRAMTAAGPAAKAEAEGALTQALRQVFALAEAYPQLRAAETIRVRFTGEWNGLYRTIPVEYRTPQGFGYRLFLTPLGASDGAGHALRYESSRERHYRKFKLWVPEARDAIRTVVFHYRAANA